MALDKAALAEIKRLYHGNELTLAQIGDRYGITATAVSRIARSRGWLMRSELRGYAPRHSVPTTPKACALLVHRLCDVIVKKLDQMEADMAAGKLSSEDYERDTKSVAQMIASVGKAVMTGTDADKERKPKSAEPDVPAAAADEAERLHREIIERFERIQRRRDAEAGSG